MNNAGVFNKRGANGTTIHNGVAFDNSGLLDLSGGILVISGTINGNAPVLIGGAVTDLTRIEAVRVNTRGRIGSQTIDGGARFEVVLSSSSRPGRQRHSSGPQSS